MQELPPDQPHRHIEITVRDGVDPMLRAPDLHRVVGRALEAGGAPIRAIVGVILSDDAELEELNRLHMGKDGPTDVLSFPLLPPSAYPPHPGQDPALREEAGTPGFVLPPDEPVHLGEIIVSVERARAQADEGHGGQTGDVRWSPADELRLLLTHGALHLCGWDHAEPEEEAAMRDLERALLATV
ncbi:MAG: rRNA maturation RNase YbeY [Chloroflexota bacterium]